MMVSRGCLGRPLKAHHVLLHVHAQDEGQDVLDLHAVDHFGEEELDEDGLLEGAQGAEEEEEVRVPADHIPLLVAAAGDVLVELLDGELLHVAQVAVL